MVKEEIEKLRKETEWHFDEYTEGYNDALDDVLSVVRSSEENVSEDLEKEIDKWWCSQFTDYSMKRVSNHKFIPAPAYIDSNFKQSETGKTKIAFELWMDWKVDSNDIEWDSDTIREFARHFFELGLKKGKCHE